MFDRITQRNFDKLKKADKIRFNELVERYNNSLRPEIQQRATNDPTVRIMQHEAHRDLAEAFTAIKQGRFSQK